MNSSIASVRVLCVLLGVTGTACIGDTVASPDDQAEGEQDLQADASFALASADDCVASFGKRPFMSLVASRRGWTAADIRLFCEKLDTIAKAYVTDSTFTTVTIAGTGRVQGDALQTSYYIGAVGYDLTAYRRFLQGIVGDGVIRRCIRKTAAKRVLTRSIPQGFVVDCLEEESGLTVPKPLFRVRLSSAKLGDLVDAAVGAGINIAMIRVPGVGVVVGFVGGAFYAERTPAYGAFLGCGTLLGVAATGSAAAASPVCLGAEFADVNDGTVPKP